MNARESEAMSDSRELRASKYDGRYFSKPDGTGLMRVLRGVTGAVLHTVRPDGTRGLTSPEEMEELLLSGAIVGRPDVRHLSESES